MNNPLTVLRTLDSNLSAAAEITIFGRAALALGFAGSSPIFASTRDVDAILPLKWLAAEDENLDFWEAQQRTNAELQPQGLYITHLFREVEVVIRPGWIEDRVPLSLNLPRLSVFRPATLDLILTKMARADANDLHDIGFLLKREPISVRQLQSAFRTARVPDVPEIRQLYAGAQEKVLALARTSGP